MSSTRNKKLLGAPGLTTRSKDATRAPGLATRSKYVEIVILLWTCYRRISGATSTTTTPPTVPLANAGCDVVLHV